MGFMKLRNFAPLKVMEVKQQANRCTHGELRQMRIGFEGSESKLSTGPCGFRFQDFNNDLPRSFE